MSLTSENRTNVRNDVDLAALAAANPLAAASLIAERFLTSPPRRVSSGAEAVFLSTASRTDIQFEAESLPVFRFGSSCSSAPRVLLVHGWGGSSGQLQAFVAPLVARGASVVAFDAPAHGLATGTSLAVPRFARAIVRVAQEVGPLRAVIGHSMGSAASAFAMSLGLQVDRAVFIGPPASEYDFFRAWFGTLGVPDHLLPLAAQHVVARVGVSFERLRPRQLAGDIRAPLLVIHDRDDREVPYVDGVEIAEAAADARLHTTFGLGHRRILRDPHVVQTSVNFALDSLPRADSFMQSASNPALV
jgi:pimeloyl-ACP methyl ester carboxylesterase